MLVLKSSAAAAPPLAAAPADRQLDSAPPNSTSGATAEAGARGLLLQSPADGFYAHLFGALGFGRGLRLNNPYRLSTQLGTTAESLSLTDTYLDLALGGTLGPPDGLQHGAVLHLSVAVEGIAQEVSALGYLALYRFPERFMLSARASVPVILEPDLNAGLEAALGGVALIWAGLGLNAELVYSLFYGAATRERDVTLIPVVSLQLGAWIDYEVLP
jgi:hypothetical protein